MITIYPLVSVINAADKPYSATFYADLDFIPAEVIWTINGRARYVTDAYTIVGGKYRVLGPTYSIGEAAVVVSIAAARLYGGTIDTATYTTEEQQDPATVTVTLTAQKDGVPIVHGVSIPDTPSAAGSAGSNHLQITWTPEASSENSQSRVWIRVVAADYTGYISRIVVDWDDGLPENYDYDDTRDVILDANHTYVNTTGSKVIAVHHLTAAGQTPGPTGTLPVTISEDAAYWYAHQYEITKYRSQPSFMQNRPVAWRDIEDGDRVVDVLDVNRANTYYTQLRLREIDPTGLPLNTSAYSAIQSVGPWL